MIQNAAFTATFVLLVHWLSLLVKHTIGEKWNDINQAIVHGTIIFVGVIGALQFVVLTIFQVYIILREELKYANSKNNSKNNDNGNN